MQEMTHRHTIELDIFCKENQDKCSNCGRLFHNGDTAHLGFTYNNEPAYLCNQCCSHLKETVVRHYWKEKEYESPKPNEKLWRYMDLSKFISIISTGKLYFPSASSFEDPFEGAKGIKSRKPIWDKFYMDFLREAVSTVPGKDYSNISDEELEKDAQRLLCELESSGKRLTNYSYISCWHNNEFESEAMWKLYSSNVLNAVAIQTTVEHLYLALGRNPGIDIGKVKYIDFSKQFASINGPYWYKRKSFEYEKEVRAVLISYKNNASGISIPVNVEELIQNIYISPYAPLWFEEVVRSVVLKYGIDKPVLYSQIRETPFF